MPDQRYLVTARKYRPNLFNELVAQEHVTGTLKNAIRLERLAHAYLFSGPRGVGKTTAARILAKAINCTAEPDERTDQAEPCRTCDSCRTFEEGRSLNIFEIDAASNRKVEDMQMILDKVRVPPQGSRKKVYIIDEVHMMSAHAFNALLKTLEEPPPHVLFIFATTEPHKVLPTILSRCQRFDFRRIPVPEIVARLKGICADEAIRADEASLMLLARKGDGALRDALSAFDQAVSLCGDDLRYEDLAEALRVVDVDLFFQVTGHVTAHSSAGMLRLVEHVVRSGYDLQEFLVGLAEHLRNLLVARTTGEATLIEAAEATRRRYVEAAPSFAEADLLRLMMIVDETQESIKSSTQPRMKLEMALLKMAALAHTADLREALARLDHLADEADRGSLPAALAAEAPSVVREPTPAPVAEPSRPEPPAEPLSLARETAPAPDAPEPPAATESEGEAATDAGVTDPEDEAEEPEAGAVQPEDEAEEPEAGAVQPEDEAEEPAPRPARSDERRSEETTTEASALSLFGPPALQKNAPRNAAPDTPPQALFAGSGALKTMAEVGVEPAPGLARVTSVWPRYVQAVKAERIHVGALLQHTVPVDVADDAVVIGVPDDFHRRLLTNQHAFLLKHLDAVVPGDVSRLTFTVQQDLEPGTETAAPEIDPVEYMKQKRQENPVIRALFDKFGGELVW